VKEIISEIKDYEDGEMWSKVAGYEVVTTKQRIKLYIDNDSSCCESWGWFWCNDKPQDFIGAEVRGVSITDTALNQAVKKQRVDPSSEYFEGGVMFVNIDTDRGVLQFIAYNDHNGYYGHSATVESQQLKHEASL
jgi:hypothetical protein